MSASHPTRKEKEVLYGQIVKLARQGVHPKEIGATTNRAHTTVCTILRELGFVHTYLAPDEWEMIRKRREEAESKCAKN